MKKSYLIKIAVYGAAMITFGLLLYIILFILVNGIPVLSMDLFKWKYHSDNVSMLPSIITTLYVIVGTIAIATPIGVFTGFYLVEYADRSHWLVKGISMATDMLAAVPSIVYGLFGFLFFVTYLGLGYSLISGILTVTIMILPLIIRATEEALLSVPKNLRAGSFALGAGKLRTIFTVVLPVAMPGILSGVILAMGRVIGESAALIYTLGSSTNIPMSLGHSGRTMSVHMYMLSSEGHNVREAYATAVILIVIVLLLNALATTASKTLQKGGK